MNVQICPDGFHWERKLLFGSLKWNDIQKNTIKSLKFGVILPILQVDKLAHRRYLSDSSDRLPCIYMCCCESESGTPGLFFTLSAFIKRLLANPLN